jgi:hypothetical protein
MIMEERKAMLLKKKIMKSHCIFLQGKAYEKMK